MVAVEYHQDLRKALSDPAVAALVADARAPFDRADWWEGLTRHCGLDPLYVVAKCAEGRALLPLARTGKGRLAPLSNWYSFRWRPLATPGAETLIEVAARSLSKANWRIALTGLPDEDGTATRLAHAFTAAGWRVTRETHDANHILALDGRTYEEYLASRPGALRTTLKRKAGKVSCKVLRHFDPAAWVAYEEIYRESWKPEEGSPLFLEHFARAEAAAGRLRLGVATLGGLPVAAQFWTVEGGTAFIHKLAHRETARAASPGTALTAALMAEAIDRDRVELVDFGTGNDAYKRDWMDDIRPRYRIDAIWPRHPLAWPHLAHRALRSLAPAPVRS